MIEYSLYYQMSLLGLVNSLSKPLLKRVFDLQTKVKIVGPHEELLDCLRNYIGKVNDDIEGEIHNVKVVEIKPRQKD